MTTLDAALQQFDATEANLAKHESIWADIQALLPTGPVFGGPAEYQELCLAFRRILPGLPAIDGTRIADHLFDYDDVAQMHLDAIELALSTRRLPCQVSRRARQSAAAVSLSLSGQAPKIGARQADDFDERDMDTTQRSEATRQRGGK